MLGVRISSNLSFGFNIENIVTAASKLVGWGLRSFHGRGRTVIPTRTSVGGLKLGPLVGGLGKPLNIIQDS